MCEIYRSLIRFGTYFQPILLLLMRLLWGTLLLEIGILKLADIEEVIKNFSQIGIIFPTLMAYIVGILETLCGLCLLFGLFSRLASIPVIVIMIVAYSTAHAGDLAKMTETTLGLLSFSSQGPFPFLMLSLIVLAFGPGKFSLDTLITKKVCKKEYPSP